MDVLVRLGPPLALDEVAAHLESGLNRSRRRRSTSFTAEPEPAPPLDELYARIRGDFTGADMEAGCGPGGMVRWAADTALGQAGAAADAYTPALAERLKDGQWYVRAAAARALGLVGYAAAEHGEQLAEALEDEDWLVWAEAA